MAPLDLVEVIALSDAHHYRRLSGQTGTVDAVLPGQIVHVWIGGIRRVFIRSELRVVATARRGFEFL